MNDKKLRKFLKFVSGAGYVEPCGDTNCGVCTPCEARFFYNALANSATRLPMQTSEEAMEWIQPPPGPPTDAAQHPDGKSDAAFLCEVAKNSGTHSQANRLRALAARLYAHPEDALGGPCSDLAQAAKMLADDVDAWIREIGIEADAGTFVIAVTQSSVKVREFLNHPATKGDE